MTTAPQVSDYELLRKIGGGAYGEVWLARSVATGVLRAVKIVYRASFTDERPFQREFEGIKKFEEISRSHPSQLAIFHVGRNEAAGCFYYVMELADDAEVQSHPNTPCATLDIGPETLDSRVYTPHTLRSDLAHGRLPAARALELGLALAEALAHLHSHSLVHRDIKPSNIIFVNGQPKLADIGLVTDASDQCSIVGTEGYIAPEGPGAPPADIFALGKVLYEALTGLDRRRYPEMPAEIRDWPDRKLVFELNEIILKACAADASERYRSADQMRSDLDLVRAGRSMKRRHTWERNLRYARRVALALGALGLVTVAGYWLSNRQLRQSNTTQRPPEFVWSTSDLANEEFRKGVNSLQADGNNAQAIRHFKSAIEKDPNFAEAYARLAWAHFSYGEADPNPDEGPWAAEKTVELNPNLAYGHSMLATARANELNFAAADRERKMAIELNPTQEVLLESALNLAVMGRTNEALLDLEKALRASPDSVSNKREYFYALVLGWCRQYDRALEIYGRTGAGGYWGNQQLALLHLARGDFTNFMRFSKQALLVKAENPAQVNAEFDALTKAFEEGGQQKYWELSLTFEFSKRDADHLTRMAAIHARLNKPGEAFRYLRQAMQETPIQFSTGLYTNPSFDGLREEKEFLAIEDELRGKK